MEPTVRWIEDKFKNKPLIVEATKLTLKVGFLLYEATEAFQIAMETPPAQTYHAESQPRMSGNQRSGAGICYCGAEVRT